MKIRQTFVSNSSSSSFIAVCPTDKDWLSEIEGSREYRDVFAEAFHVTSHEFLDGKEVNLYKGYREDLNGNVEDCPTFKGMCQLYDWENEDIILQADEYYDIFFKQIEDNGGFVYTSGRW